MRALVCVLRTLFFEGEKKIRDLLLEAKQKEKKVSLHTHTRGGEGLVSFSITLYQYYTTISSNRTRTSSD